MLESYDIHCLKISVHLLRIDFVNIFNIEKGFYILKSFRLVSLLEGLSYLVILSVTIEIISRNYVFSLGILHGILFLTYLLLSLNTSHKQGWSMITWLLIFLASIIPFAFIAVDYYLRKEMREELSTNDRQSHT